MSDKFSTRLVSEIEASAHTQRSTTSRPTVIPNIIQAVRSKTASSLSFQENFPFLSEIAAMSPEEMMELAEKPGISKSLILEAGDFCDFLRETEHSSANHAFIHFIGNLSHSFQLIFRNHETRNKYAELVSSIPSFARALRIIATKEPKPTYFRIVSESETRVANVDYSPQSWLSSVRRIIS